jgi:DNA gyrase subunit A
VTQRGYALRFGLAPHAEPSTRAGRRYAKVAEGDEVIGVRPAADNTIVIAAAASSHALSCRAGEVNLLQNPGRGVTLIKLADGDRVLGFTVGETLVAETGKGKRVELEPSARSLAARGGKGYAHAKRDGFARVIAPAPTVPQLNPTPTGNGESQLV